MQLPQTVWVCLALLLVSCRGLQEIAPTVQPSMAGDSLRLTEGRQIYLNCCFNCHSIQAIDALSEEKWADILPGMVKKAKLNPDNAAKLYDYLRSARQWRIQTNTNGGP